MVGQVMSEIIKFDNVEVEFTRGSERFTAVGA